MTRFSRQHLRKLAKRIFFVIALLLIIGLFLYSSIWKSNFPVYSKSIEEQIESAIYRREEFFGSQAIVPIPTAVAYENLLKLAEVNNPKVFEKLAELAEKLEKFDEAESYLIKAENPKLLADFYQCRGNFQKKAEILEQLLRKTKQLDVFDELITFAQIHELDQYLQIEFFQQIADESESALPIIDKLIDKLVRENQTEKALAIIRNYKSKFPEKMLAKEIFLLSPKEAEIVYYQSFNPFWSDEQTERFYQFLNDNDRFRSYGSELKAKFRQDPADYEIAIRLIHYKQYDYDDSTPIVLQLEKNKKTWKTEELLTIAGLLLKADKADLSSKFLYTLHLRDDFTPEMRSKISYQIFKILCQAENERLPLTKGNLNFYRDVAAADTNPGITTGILSLIFSDTHPNREIVEKEKVATKFFNQAAAYRVFQNYKNEFPNSPKIGQMYLDLIDIYRKAKNFALAEKLLNEFAGSYEQSSDFPRVAMNLAEAFLLNGEVAKQRQIYQKVMDFLGKEGKFTTPKKSFETPKNTSNYKDKNLTNKYSGLLGNISEQIAYSDVLSRYIESLSKEKKIAEILEIYSNEITKYPEQEWLYDLRATWLEQTNLFDEQLKIYKTALEKFPTNTWRDKLARWFIRNKRETDFAQFSSELIEKLDDAEIQNYLTQFVAERIFEDKLNFKLYQKAHQRFPHNLTFVKQLLKFYRVHKLDNDWKNLAAEYYFESSEIRKEFLDELAKKGKITDYVNQAKGETVIYQLFKADVNLRLSHFEEALQEFRKLKEIYPNNPEFSNHLINLSRSFGQKNQQILNETAHFAKKRADFEPSNSLYRTESGEINAELGNYQAAKNEWQKLIEISKGSGETYLETAGVCWDYFQYDEALKTIKDYRIKSNNPTIYAFQVGAILESQDKQNEAISEYLNALENDDGNAQKRLKVLAKNQDVFNQINTIFQHQKKSDWKTLRFADILRDLEKENHANDILLNQIKQSNDSDLLESAEDFSDKIQPRALNRLAEISTSPRKSISYRLQLADFYRENNQPKQAKQVLASLQQKFPNNYGVLTTSADFYWSLGANEAAIQVLQNGFAKAKGDYRFAFASRLAKKMIFLNRLAEAEKFLVEIHQENPTDSEVFHELAGVFVHQGKAEKLREKFAETVKAIKAQNIEPKELDWEIATMREEMITAFTQLKDHHSAIEQHIEIINRNPDETANIDAAILYVKRYGEADVLLNYYQKLSAQAFKNYRWNVVLARIFEVKDDLENAVKNYQKAIDSQPEMTEFYTDLVRLETKRKNYSEALTNLNQIIELSGENKEILKQKVQLLQLLGRNDEAQNEQKKLPVETEQIIIPENQFAEAERAKSIKMFQTAFANLLEKPLENELKAENITSYITTLRQEENLDLITERLFLLREKLLKETIRQDSKFAGEARNRLKILNHSMSNTIGNIAKTFGTHEELLNLHNSLNQKIEEISNEEQNGTLTFLQDFSARAGFGDLVEKVLIKRRNLNDLTNFYNERGAFQKVLELAESENNQPLIAENAKLLGDREKELTALRQIFQDKNANPGFISRYLQIIDKTELESLAKQDSPHQLQLINFLLGKGEKELVHLAIENSAFQKSWKLARQAEASLALKEFDEQSECYFCDALNLGTIGDLAMSQPNKIQQLIGLDWFRLSRQYGEWLDAKKMIDADKFLPALIEVLPKQASQQTKLGEFYLGKNELEKANEHFQISLELDNENIETLAKSAETLWRIGEKEQAGKILEKVLTQADWLYLETMTRLNLRQQAQLKLLPYLISKIDQDKDVEDIIYRLAQGFDSEKKKAEYFLRLANESKKSEALVQKIIQFELVSKEFRQPFYEKLLSKLEYESSNYEFEEISRRTFSNEDAEEIYDHEKDFADAPRERDDKFTYQYDYLEFLLENSKTTEAKRLILLIENEMKGRFPRPILLRLKHFELFGGNLQKLVGIEVTNNVKEPKPPSIERLNAVITLLRNSKRDIEAEKIMRDFYLRMIELHNFQTANFIGLARQYFKLGENEKGLKALQKLSEIETFNDFKNIAEVYAEFGFREKAIEFRQKLIEVSPNDFENKFELAKLLSKNESVQILQTIANDRNTPRYIRWQAIWKLYETGEKVGFPHQSFDSFSQFYKGIILNDENYFLNALIADKETHSEALQKLTKLYANTDKPFAALRLAEIDKSAKSDELLDLLSKSAEKVGEFQKAIEFESAKSKIDEARIKDLKSLDSEKNKRVTDFTVDAGNTRNL